MRPARLLAIVGAALVAATALAVAGAGAAGAIEVAITNPADGAHSLSGVVPVQVRASATAGVYAVQLNVDGTPYGSLVTTPTSQYVYSVPWNTATVPVGTHTLTATAVDWSQPYPPGGARVTSAAVVVDVGPAYPTVSITSPVTGTFVRGTVQVQLSSTSAIGPVTTTVTVDGAPITPTATSPWTGAWVSTQAADGQHVVAASVTDGRGKSAQASATVTVDNTAPTVAILAPAAGSYVSGTLAAQAHASDAFGVRSIQFAIDGRATGPALAQPDAGAPYTYSATLDLAGVTAGPHALTAVAVDGAGNVRTSASTSFTVGAAPPSVTVTVPPDWTFARGVVPVTAVVSGGTPPLTVRLLVDGAASALVDTTAPYTFQWDSTKVASGSHLLGASVVDAQSRTATSASIHQTVDNVAPSAYLIAPSANLRVSGVTLLKAHASDAYGIASVQFTVDGAPVAAPVTVPDAGRPYEYSLTYDTSALAAGAHLVGGVVTDSAGNRTTVAGVSIVTGPITYLPVLNFHEINPPGGYTIYDETPAQADAELAWLKANGYQSVTLDQYRQWLAGQSIGVAKPVLITVDDGLKSEKAWDGLLAKYGFKAVLFVITGWADMRTPGDDDPNNLTWAEIQALAATGRWQIALHAGTYGHGDAYADGARIGLQSYQPACPYFYSCLSGIRIGRLWTPESVTAFKTAVTNEVNAGIAELRQKVPTASLLAWAAPFNDAGQWTNLYNDTTGQVQAWLPGFMASKFPIVFTQTNPVTYAQASGTVGSLSGFNRRYRFEVHTDTTVAQLAAALTDPAFAR